MRYTDEDVARAAEAFERTVDKIDPATVKVTDTNDLRAIAEYADAVHAAEAKLREAVDLARAHGRSWNRIALALGVSRQAARQRFARKVDA